MNEAEGVVWGGKEGTADESWGWQARQAGARKDGGREPGSGWSAAKQEEFGRKLHTQPGPGHCCCGDPARSHAADRHLDPGPPRANTAPHCTLHTGSVLNFLSLPLHYYSTVVSPSSASTALYRTVANCGDVASSSRLCSLDSWLLRRPSLSQSSSLYTVHYGLPPPVFRLQYHSPTVLFYCVFYFQAPQAPLATVQCVTRFDFLHWAEWTGLQ